MISFDLFEAFVEIQGDMTGGVDFNQIRLRCTLNEEDNVIDIGLEGATRIQNYMPFGWTEPNKKHDHTLIVDSAVTDLLLQLSVGWSHWMIELLSLASLFIAIKFGETGPPKLHQIQVRDWYLGSFRDLRSCPEIKEVNDEKEFTKMIKMIKDFVEVQVKIFEDMTTSELGKAVCTLQNVLLNL
ncbi:cytochrome b561, DM13 and DOMON domain-containing protein [Tanacetum coccineum]